MNDDEANGSGMEETLAREAEEELGIGNLVIEGLYGVTTANFKIHVDGEAFGLFFAIYKCKIPEGSALKLSGEHSEYRWVGVPEARSLLSFLLPEDFLKKLTKN